jgi:hypothetical protein
VTPSVTVQLNEVMPIKLAETHATDCEVLPYEASEALQLPLDSSSGYPTN